MAIPGRLYGTRIGPSAIYNRLTTSGAGTYAMAALNTGWCARFMATQNKDIFSVKVNFSAVTAAGTIEARIETIDATTGKPTGTLYDAAATKSFTPVTGWQTVTFDTGPTTNLTVGTEYGLVLLTTTGGTTMTLRANVYNDSNFSFYPQVTLTAADGTTRSNFAELANSGGAIASFLLDDGTEDPMGLLPYAVAANATPVYGTVAYAAKFVVDGTISAYGVEFLGLRNGTPAGDLRVRILNTSGSALSNSTVTIDKDSILTGLNSAWRTCVVMFGGLVELATGTYYITFDSSGSANSGNSWSLSAAVPVDTTVIPDGFIVSTTADVTAGPPPTWTDSATGDQPMVRLLINDITAPAGGGNANLMHGKLQ